MPDFTSLASFEWLEGGRTFDIVFGTISGAAAFSLGAPILRWCMPQRRVFLFGRRADPRQVLQALYGVLCMSMATAGALCRYIPHARLGIVHPIFFLTITALCVLLGPRVVKSARRTAAPLAIRDRAMLAAGVVVLAALPVTSVIAAFRR